MLRNELCRMVKTCMIAPLVDDLQTPFADRHVVHCILRENRQLIGLDHLGDAVIDLGVDVIRPSRKEDGVLARLFNTIQDLLSVVTNILSVLLNLGITGIDRRSDLRPADALGFAELLHETLDHALAVIDGQERLQEADVILAQDIHVDANVLRIGCDDRAVVVVRRRVGLVLHVVRFARIEDRIDALFDEVGNMPVGELCRVAERV